MSLSVKFARAVGANGRWVSRPGALPTREASIVMRIRTGLIAAGIAVGVAACSSGSSSNAHSASTPTTSHSAAALTVQEAKTLAAAAILRDADMPGYTAKPGTHDATDVRSEAQEQRCLGLPPQQFRARDFGKEFTKGDLEVDSSADVASSVADGKQQLAAITGSKAKGCLKQALDAIVAASGGTVRSFSANLVPATIADADAAFAYQLSVQAAFNGQAVTIAGYEVGTLVGQVEVDTQATGTAPLPLTLAQAEHLAQISTSRERAAQRAAGIAA
jgi:hypothetical protein